MTFILGVPVHYYTTISEDFHRRPKISEDVSNNSEVFKRMTMLIRTFKNQRFRGKYRHLLILLGIFLSCIGLSLHIFGKRVS